MSERKMIYLCLAHMSEAGMEQKYVKEAFGSLFVFWSSFSLSCIECLWYENYGGDVV